MSKRLLTWCLSILAITSYAQNFTQSDLDYNGFSVVQNATSLEFGPDGRLYVLDIDGQINIYSTIRVAKDQYRVTAQEVINDVRDIPNHNDDGSAHSGSIREATGLTIAGSQQNPIIYITSSDARIGGPSGDKNLDTNSGVITRLSWSGSNWEVVDIVRGLPRSEENHATNGLEYAVINGEEFLIVCSGGHTNAGSPSVNFAWTTEYALSAAVISVNLTQIQSMTVKLDGARSYIYDIPTLDDPTRDNIHPDGSAASEDPNSSNYSPLDIGDPWGGNDGLNQAMIVPGGPVQIFSPGYRNSYDLVLTVGGAVYVTDNGPNGGWGGLPENEGSANVTNNYLSSEPGSTSLSDGERVNNRDHLTRITTDIQNYTFGSYYGGHPVPVRANPIGAGLYTNPGSTSVSSNARFRTAIYDPNGSTPGSTTSQLSGLPANWPPVPSADSRQGDFRSTGDSNPDGPNDSYVTTWSTNTNGIDEYTASNFSGALKGDLIAGKSGGKLFKVDLDGSGSFVDLDENFQTNLGGNPLGVTCNGDNDPHPGTIWVATFNNTIKVLEPSDAVDCILPGEPGYSASFDNDADGYTNQDEIDNRGSQTIQAVICSPGNQPSDFDKNAGGALVSDLNDLDDDNDGISDSADPFQLGDFNSGGSDAFTLPVNNELISDNLSLGGYLGLGFTGMMNNGAIGGNWLDWIDVPGDGPNPNDLLGGAIGAMTMQMGSGTAFGTNNSQRKAFQYGVQVSESTGGFTVKGRLFNFTETHQLYHSATPSSAELGIFIGDGSQSNYIKLMITQAGILFQQEINDVPQSAITVNVPVAERPADPNDDVIFTLSIDPVAGLVTALYSFDQGATFETVGVITASGSVLSAIQSAGEDLAVGLLGSSGVSGVEVEGSWDYLKVEGSQPYMEQPLPDLQRTVNAPNEVLNLEQYFNDNDGHGNLTYTIVGNTNPAIGTSITGADLAISYPATAASSLITVRASDGNGLFIEDVFYVNVAEGADLTSIMRIRAFGNSIAASNGPHWQGASTTGSFSNSNFSVNTGNEGSTSLQTKHTSVPSYVPLSIYNRERWDHSDGEEMTWLMNVANGEYTIRLYLGNGYSGTSQVGERIFDIWVEGVQLVSNFDPVASYGHLVGGMLELTATVSDEELEIWLEHVVQNPNIFGIELLGYPVDIEDIADQTYELGQIANFPVIATGGKNGNFLYSATGLPHGIQIEPTTGLIFGTLSSTGSFNPTVTVTRPGSISDEFAFNWTVNAPPPLMWTDQNDVENYTARHECSFVQAGDKFFLFGGRENSTTLDVYDYGNKSWSSITNSAPKEFNHFQATEYNGLIWVIGAFKDNGFPTEAPEENIWMYNPATNEWIQGPTIPSGRRRGSAGLVVYDDKFYIVGGNTDGHNGGFVAWFDEFDPETGQWTALTNAPRARDHFHAAVIGDKLYVAGGRLSGGVGGTFEPLIAEVDVYDFVNRSWTTETMLPTPRAAATTGVLEGRLVVAGGEIRTDLGGSSVNDAVAITESYDPVTGIWYHEEDLNFKRHGTQAIVSGDGMHVASGSPNMGGGRIHKMEYLGVDNPQGIASDASELVVPGSLELAPGGSVNFTISSQNGNVGVILKDITISGTHASEFSIAGTSNFSLLKAGSDREYTIMHTGSLGGRTATLTYNYNNGLSKVTTLSTVYNTGTLNMKVELQGHSDYSGVNEVVFCESVTGNSVLAGNYSANSTGDLSITGIVPGTYNVYIRRQNFLRRAIMGITIGEGSNTLSLTKSAGLELRAGDGNNSNSVNSADLDALTASYYLTSNDTGFNSNYDIDGSGRITIRDFSVLASNYGDHGGANCGGLEHQPSDNDVSLVSLYCEPASLSLAQGEISSFFVRLDNPSGVEVNGVDLRMVFNTSRIEILEISDAFGWDVELLNRLELGSARIMYTGGVTTSSGPSGNDRLLKVKVRALAETGNSTFYFDRSEPMLTEVTAKGYSVYGSSTPLTITNLGPCPSMRTVDHDLVIDGEFMAGQMIQVMGNVNIFNTMVLDAPKVEIPGSLDLPQGGMMTVKKDGCQ